MTSIWWFLAAFVGGAVAALLVFASLVVLFALAKLALGRPKRILRAAVRTDLPQSGADDVYDHPSMRAIATH